MTAPLQASFQGSVSGVMDLDPLLAQRLAAIEARITALEALKSPVVGKTYYKTNFSDGKIDPLVFYSYGGSGIFAPSSDYVDPGSTKSIKCTIPGTKPDDAAALCAWFGHGGLAAMPLDPTLDQDLFQQIRFVVAPGAYAAIGGQPCTPANATSQFKLHKSVYGQVGSNINGWMATTINPCTDWKGFPYSQAERWTQPTAVPDTIAWPALIEGIVYDVVYRYHRYTAQGVGTVALWVNGVKLLDTPKRDYLGYTAGSAQGLNLQDGAVYLQNPKGPYSVYVLFTQATNFPIGAGVASA